MERRWVRANGRLSHRSPHFPMQVNDLRLTALAPIFGWHRLSRGMG